MPGASSCGSPRAEEQESQSPAKGGLNPRAVIALGLAVLAFLAGPPRVSAGLADRVGVTFELMAAEFVTAFEPVEGLVIAIDGDTPYVDIGGERGAEIGQEYVIFRKGAMFFHPLTQNPLGRYEDILGWAQVRRVEPRFSMAKYVPADGKPRPRPGDGARISRARIRVAVTPLLDLTESNADVRRVPYLIARTLEHSDRFQVVDPLTVLDAFADGEMRIEEVLSLPDRAVQHAKDFDVAAWVVPLLLERRGVVYLDVTWVSAVTGAALFWRREPLLPATATEEQRFPWEPPASE